MYVLIGILVVLLFLSNLTLALIAGRYLRALRYIDELVIILERYQANDAGAAKAANKGTLLLDGHIVNSALLLFSRN